MQYKTSLLVAVVAVAALLVGAVLWRSPAAGQASALNPAPLARAAVVSAADGLVQQSITVAGTGEVRVKPDVAFATLGVQTQAPQANQAQQDNAAAMAAVIDAIKKLAIPDSDIQTAGISLYPVYDTQRQSAGGQGQITGYRATNQVTVRLTDLSKVGPVLDESVNAGANLQGGVSFGLLDPSGPRQEALKRAVTDARSKADAIASAVGVSVAGTYAIMEQSVSVPMPQRGAVPAAAPAMAQTPVEPGELTVTAQVQVIYNY